MTVEKGFTPEDLAQIIPLLGEKAEAIHMPVGSPEGVGGGDVDCFVWRLDRRWPLRLPSGWKLLQILRYDSVAWYWILERDGAVIAIDTLSDPWGIGQYAWPITGSSLPLTAGQRAGYLTTKRLRKGIRSEEEWTRIRGLAREDPTGFERALTEGSMGALGPAVARAVLTEGRPDQVWEQARRTIARRRLLRGGQGARLAVLQIARTTDRFLRPTGLAVTIVGPDGTGKSSVTSALLESCAAMFRRTHSDHWRPGLLPSSAGSEGRDVTQPHATKPRGKAASLLAGGYHWLDFFLAGWTRDRFRRARSTLSIRERGWEDLAVDPQRYRLHISPGLVRAAARLLPRSDLAVVLQVTPEVARARKQELTTEELAKQSQAWRERPPRARRVLMVDADRGLEEVVGSIRKEITETLNRRAVARLGGGWAGLPDRRAPRWWIPRRPAGGAKHGATIYQPVTPKGLAGWRAARAFAGAGGFRLMPRGPGIPEEVRDLVGGHVPRGGTISLLRANHPNRYVALVMEGSGAPVAVAKVALDDTGASALRREADALASIARSLPPPLRAPQVLGASDGSLVTEAIRWAPRSRPWRLDEEVAGALGRWFAAEGGSPTEGNVHGDCAPWNLLRADDGWVLVDWEEARSDGEPFDDIFHFVVQAHALLGRPKGREVIEGVSGRGHIGRAIQRYGHGAGLSADDLGSRFVRYLKTSMQSLDGDRPDGAAGLRARRLLLQSSVDREPGS